MSKNKKNRQQGSGLSKREQLRLRQEAEAQKAKRQKVVVVAVIVVALAVLVTLGVILFNTWSDGQKAAKRGEGVTASQVTPKHVSDNGYTIAYAQDSWDKSKPRVTVFMDPQCPGCAIHEQILSSKWQELADNGDIRLEYQMLHGLDRMLGTQYSFQGVIGMTCADNQDHFAQYALELFKAQPEHEGDGWTPEQLRVEIPTAAGLSGQALSDFQKCYDEKATHDFAMKMQDNVPSVLKATPSYVVDGKLAEFDPTTDFASAETLLAAVNREAKK